MNSRNLDSSPDKIELRRHFRALVKHISPATRAEYSARACETLRQQQIWRDANAILFYAAMSTEVDLTPLIHEAATAGRAVVLPRFMAETGVYEAVVVENFAKDCATGKFGIVEPGAHCPTMPLNRLDLVLVPGLGFDTSGHRLGRGQGFYDRLLAGIAGVKCGVAFDQQVVAQLPSEGHDVAMNFVLTPTRWLEVS